MVMIMILLLPMVGSGTKHLPGPASRRFSSDSGGYVGTPDPYGTFFRQMEMFRINFSAMSHSCLWIVKRWFHNHAPSKIHITLDSAQEGIDTGVQGTTLVNESGGGQMAPGTGSVGAHTHNVQYTLNRTHNHSISGQQTGNIQMSGFDSK